MEVGSNANLRIMVSTKRSLKLRCFQLASENTFSGWPSAALTSATRTRLSVANEALK